MIYWLFFLSQRSIKFNTGLLAAHTERMSSNGREGKLPAIDIEDVCEYFGGDLDMASMFLNLLNSDVASGSTCAVGESYLPRMLTRALLPQKEIADSPLGDGSIPMQAIATKYFRGDAVTARNFCALGTCRLDILPVVGACNSDGLCCGSCTNKGAMSGGRSKAGEAGC